MKIFIDWCMARWIWISMLLLIVILGFALFATYAVKLPYVSNEHAAWASFGSLLSGFFTLTSSLATVATLLFLARQNKDMQKVTHAQLSTMTFDRYISHRKLFVELLEEQEKSLGGRFRFRDPTLLYSSIFPDNSLHNCELLVSPLFDEYGAGTNHLGRLYAKLHKIKVNLQKPDFNSLEGFDLIADFMDLRYDLLMLEQERSIIEGDVVFHNRAQGFNLFMLNDFVRDVVKLANVIFSFVKCPLLNEIQFHSVSAEQRDWLLNELYAARGRGTLVAYSNIQFVPDLVLVRASLGKLALLDESLANARRRLDELFASTNVIEVFRDRVILKGIVESCSREVELVYEKFLRGDHGGLIAEVHLELCNIKFNL